MPFTEVRVMLSAPGTYVPLNCPLVGTGAVVATAVEVAVVVETTVLVAAGVAGVAGVVLVATIPIRGLSAPMTAALFELRTTLLVPCGAVMIYPDLPTETMPLNVTVADAPGVVPVGATRNESSANTS